MRRLNPPVSSSRDLLVARDVLLVAALAVTLLIDSALCDHGDPSLTGAGAVGLITLPLLWRSRRPRTVLVVVLLGVVACLLTLKPTTTVALPVMVATYAVAVRSDRGRSVVLALVLVSVSLVCVVVFSDEGPRPVDLLMNVAFMLFAVAAGDAVRTRQAFAAAQREREQEKEREQRAEAQRLVAEERLRIAREVHDVVAHAMVAINVQAGVAAHVVDRRPEQALSALRQIKATSGEALADLRATLGTLRDDDEPDASKRPTDALTQVPDLAAALRAAGVSVDVRVEGLAGQVPAHIGAAVYRIVQEATTNILRHAGARSALIAVDVGRSAVEVRVEDDGAALVPVGGAVTAGSGNGLRGMSERVGLLGGRLEAGRQPDGGWRVRGTLPIG